MELWRWCLYIYIYRACTVRAPCTSHARLVYRSFEAELEEMMLMEAIRLSMLETPPGAGEP